MPVARDPFYDSASFATSSSSSSSSSPPAVRHRLIPKPSPSPSRPYSPSSREADIARLLDPAYASPAPYSPLSRSPRMAVKEVYVDHHGDLHDPDFRDFPPFHPRRRDDDDDDDEECDIEQRHPFFEPKPRRPSSSVTYHPPPVYYPYEEPASYESRYFEDEDEEEERPLKEKSFCRRPRSPTKSKDEKTSSPTTEGDHVIQADSDWTPTCTENLRRHWQAISLSFRFTLFRTKRRLRRRMTG